MKHAANLINAIIIWLVGLVPPALGASYTTLSTGLDKTATPYNIGINLNGIWYNFATITAGGVFNLPISSGGTGQATASAAFNALSPMTTAGDLIYGGASGAGTRLPAGASTQFLMSGTTPSWITMSGDATLAGTGALTLATVNANVGSWGGATQAPQITVDAKGRITAATNVTVTPAIGSITGLGAGVPQAAAIATNANGGFPTVSVSATAPSVPSLFQPWLDTTAAPYVWKIWTGAWTAIGTLDPTTHAFTSPTLNLAATPSGGFGGVSGILPATSFPALTGDCATIAGALAVTCTKTNGAPFVPAATTATAILADAIAGVDPTGVSDSTTGLANALTAAAGKTLVLGQGATYLVSAFNIPAGTKISANGATIKRLASNTRTDGSSLVEVASGVKIDGDLTIDLNSPVWGNWVSGVAPSAATTDVSLRNITIINPSFSGLYWHDNNRTWSHVRTRFENVKVTNAGWVGAQFRSITEGSASGVTVIGSGFDGVEVEDCNQFVLEKPIVNKAASPPVIFNGAGNALATNSTTSTTIGTGSKTFTVASGLNYQAPRAVYIVEHANHANYMYGATTAYSGTSLTVNVTSVGGSGTFTDWDVVGENGMMIWRGIRNSQISIVSPNVFDNRNAVSDGIGIGENGTTSATSVTVGTGAQIFTVANSGRDYPTGAPVTIFSSSSPSTIWMKGRVTSYSGTTLAVSVTESLGSGAHTDWVVNTEPGPEVITGAVIGYAGLFGLDMNSNTKVDGAYIDTPAQRGLEFGLDYGGMIRNASASNVTVRNAGSAANSGTGMFWNNGAVFNAFESIRVQGFQAFDDRPTQYTTYGIVVNTATSSFVDVAVDNASSTYDRVATAPYLAFGGGTDPRLNGAWASFSSTLTWTGGTPTGPTISMKYDPSFPGKTRPFSALIYTGSALNGATTVAASLPFTQDSATNCVPSAIQEGSHGWVPASVAAGTSTLSIFPTLSAGAYYSISGVCQTQ